MEDEWTQTRVGLLLYYQYEDYEAGKEYMHRAADAGYEPAKEAIRAINNNLNAQIIIGVCDLFYYASNIIDAMHKIKKENPIEALKNENI